jgi:hypothetical protein
MRGKGLEKLRRFFVTALALAVLAAPAAQAATIAEWNIAGSNGVTAAVLSTALGVSATNLTPTGVTGWPGGYCCFTAAAGWGASTTNPNLGRYYQFSITADPGHQITYEAITLSLFRGLGSGGRHGANRWQLRSSADGFGSSLALFDITSSAADQQILFSNVDISAVGTQAGTVTFRLYGYDYNYAADYSGLGGYNGVPGGVPITGTGSNVVVSGVVLPEPFTLAQVGLGLAMLGFAGRRRSRAARA